MYCRECGNAVDPKSEICTSCGVRPLNSTNYCQSCGSKTNENQELCISCGAGLQGNKKVSNGEDNPSSLVGLAACCFPIVGLILYIVWKNDKPKSAKSVCKWAVIGTVAGILLYIVAAVLGVLSEVMYY